MVTTWCRPVRHSQQNALRLLSMGSISSGLAYVSYYRGLQASNTLVASVLAPPGPVTRPTPNVLLLPNRCGSN